MASFSDWIGGLFGQKELGQQTITQPADLFSQSNQLLTSQIAPGTVAYNQALAPGLTGVQLGVTDQLDPNILNNLRGSNASILNQLNMGTQMDPQLQSEITRNLLATNAGSGFGASAGGVGNILYQTAIDKQNLLRQRQQDALNAGGQGFQLSRQLYKTQYPWGEQPGQMVAGQILGTVAAEDEKINLARQNELENMKAATNTVGKIIGSVVGGIYGGPAGAQIGGQIGGSLYGGSSVQGYGQQPQSGAGQGAGGGGFGSILSMFGGGGTGGMSGQTASPGSAAAVSGGSEYGGFGMMA